MKEWFESVKESQSDFLFEILRDCLNVPTEHKDELEENLKLIHEKHSLSPQEVFVLPQIFLNELLMREDKCQDNEVCHAFKLPAQSSYAQIAKQIKALHGDKVQYIMVYLGMRDNMEKLLSIDLEELDESEQDLHRKFCQVSATAFQNQKSIIDRL